MGNYRYIFVGIGIFVSFNSFSMAGDVWWDACNGNWSDAANWSPKIPTSNDTVYIDNGCGGPSIGKGDSFARTLYVGMDTAGNTIRQSGVLPNSLTVNDLYLGFAAGSEGTYTLSGVGRLSVGKYAYLGLKGNGTFKQSGGIFTLNEYLFLGDSPGTVGVYEMTGGEVNSPGGGILLGGNYYDYFLYDDKSIICMGGTGIFRHSGGKVKIPHLEVDGMGSRYELFGKGELTVSPNNTVYIAGIWPDKVNRFIQSGGKHTAGGIFVDSRVPDGPADYTLTDGTLSATGLGFGIDVSGTAAKFIQSGGSITVANDVRIRTGGQYELGGIGSVSMNNLQLGFEGGSGKFLQTGGINTIRGDLYLGQVGKGTPCTVRYELSGDSQLTVQGNEIIGQGSSQGDFSQAGGVHVIQSFLYLGNDRDITGTFTMDGGELVAQLIWVGYKGTGELNQTGGTVNTIRLDIGRDAGSIGQYFLDHTGQLAVDDRLTVGRSGEGIMGLTGGKVATKSFSIGRYAGRGTLSLTPSSEVIVTQELAFGSKAEFGAEPGSRILMGYDSESSSPASFLNLSQDPFTLSGLGNLDLSFEGGVGQAATMEIAGGDAGIDEMGFWANFALGVLRIGTDTSVGHVKLVDDTDNGTGGPGFEVLYVDRIVLTPGSILDLNGHKVYYHTLCNDGGTINLKGGSLTQVGIPGDLDYNGIVDIDDLKGFIGNWMWKGLECGIPEDLACGGDVNLLDFSVLASHWLEQ